LFQQRIKTVKKRKESLYSISVKVGSLVVPTSFNQRESFYLTPISVFEQENFLSWPEWKKGEIGIVLPPEEGQIGIKVLIPDGVGLCFFDEIKEIL